MRRTTRESVRCAVWSAVVVAALAAAGPVAARSAAQPCCGVVPLASIGALPGGFSPTLAISILPPNGFTLDTPTSFVAPGGKNRITFEVSSGAAGDLRRAALAAAGGGRLLSDAPIDVPHEIVSGTPGSPAAPVGVGTIRGQALIAVGHRLGALSASAAFPLGTGPAAPVVVVHLAGGSVCCTADLRAALRAALDGVSLRGNLPATTIEARLEPSNAQPCCDAVLAGSATDAFGEPLVGISVSLAPAGAKPCCQASTSALGRFSLPLPRTIRSGMYTLTIDSAETCCDVTRSIRLDLASVSTVPPPVNLLDPNRRWVIAHPHIVNLMWDNHWNQHNPYSIHQIDVAAKAISDSHYLDDAAQYGVGRANFVGAHEPSVVCPTRRPGATVSSASLLKWVTCEVSTLHPPSRLPVTNDLFVVYVPQGTSIVDGPSLGSFSILGNTFGPFTLPLFKSCTDYDGYHFLSLAITGPFAYAVVPLACATDFLHLTEVMSHEIVEAATDPVLTTGWIDNAYPLGPPAFERLLKGEAADLCELKSGAQPTAPLNTGQLLLDPYWSNAAGACVAHF